MRIPISKCQGTASCSSTEIEAVRIQPPVKEPDPLRYEYDGYCPVCNVPIFGCFRVKRDQTTAEKTVSPASG